MINLLSNTVFTVLNKNNYGYISPSDFNLFAKQAQLDIFENYFVQYNQAINRENTRQSGTDYADDKKGIEESIDLFSVSNFLTHSSANTFFLPSPTTTGDDYFLLNKVLCYTSELSSGTNTSVSANELVDSSADFVADGIKIGDIVANTTDNTTAYVVAISSATALTLSADIFTATAKDYIVYDATKVVEAEKINHSKITMLTNSLLTAPSTLFPAYTQQANLLTVFPSSIDAQGGIYSQYIRYPKDPKWTYVSLSGGEPSYDPTQSDFQDFEVPIEDETTLVSKILQYAGMSIREIQVVQAAGAEEAKQMQK